MKGMLLSASVTYGEHNQVDSEIDKKWKSGDLPAAASRTTHRNRENRKSVHFSQLPLPKISLVPTIKPELKPTHNEMNPKRVMQSIEVFI